MLRRLLVPLTILLIVVVDLVMPAALRVEEPLRGALAVPVVLFLPGYTVTLALFSRRDLGVPERIVFSVALSLILLALEGLLLNATIAGLTGRNWGSVVAASILLPLGALVVRTLRAMRRTEATAPDAEEAAQAGVRGADEPAPLVARVSRRQVGYIAAGAVLIAAAGVVAVTGALAQPQTRFTQLWLLGSSDARVVEIGLTDLEDTRMSYRVELSAGDSVIAQWPDLELGAGETWRQTVTLASPRAEAGTLVAKLYTPPESSSAYRLVTLEPGTAPAR